MKSKKAVLFVICFLATTAIAHQAGYEEKIWLLQNSVTVDGDLATTTGEWVDAAQITVSGLTDGLGNSQIAELSLQFKQDTSDLFISLSKDSIGKNNNRVMIYFDVNHDAALDAGDKAVQLEMGSAKINVATYYDGTGGAWTPTAALSWTMDATSDSLEFQIPLSAVGLDTTGNINGFGVITCDTTTSTETIGWPDFYYENSSCADFTSLAATDPPVNTPTSWGNITRTEEVYPGISDGPTLWGDINFGDYTSRGQPISDYETSKDPSNGGAAVQPDNIDIASDTAGSTPGGDGSVLLGYSAGTGTAVGSCKYLDDSVVGFKTWIDGDPHFKTGYASRNWNFLLDVDTDGYKEFWIDLAGWYSQNSADVIYLYYEDENSNELLDEINSLKYVFPASSLGYDGDYDSCNDVNGSFACVKRIAGGKNEDDAGEPLTSYDWELTAQIPIKYLDLADDGTANCSIDIDTPMQLFYSTSASNTNPLQKDWMMDCNDTPNWTIDDPLCFGDTVTLDPTGGDGSIFTLRPLAYDETVGPGTILNFAHELQDLDTPAGNQTNDYSFSVSVGAAAGGTCGTVLNDITIYIDNDTSDGLFDNNGTTDNNGILDSVETTILYENGSAVAAYDPISILKGESLYFIVVVAAGSAGDECEIDITVSDDTTPTALTKTANDDFNVVTTASKVKLNELMYDPATGAEWLELTNMSPWYPMDVSGWDIADNDGNNFTLPSLSPMPASSTCPNGDEARIIIVNASGANETDWTDCLVTLFTGNDASFGGGSDWFNNSSDGTSLCSGTCSQTTIIDYVAYGDDPGTGDDYASAAGIWPNGIYAPDIPTGSSLSRLLMPTMGDGWDSNTYTDWYEAIAPSPGEKNTPSIVINEVEIEGTDVDWAELYIIEDGIAGDAGINIANYMLTNSPTAAGGSSDPDSSFADVSSDEEVWISNGEYAIIHFNDSSSVDETYSYCLVNDCGEYIDLYVGDGYPSISGDELVLATADSDGQFLDGVIWDTGSTTVLENYTVNTVAVPMWDSSTTVDTSLFTVDSTTDKNTMGRDSQSTDTNSAVDWADTSGKDAVADTQGRQNVGAVINEVMIDPLGTSDNQWIEIYCGSPIDFSSTPYQLAYNGGSINITSGTCGDTSASAPGYFQVDLGSTSALNTSSDTISLVACGSGCAVNGDNSLADFIAYGSDPMTNDDAAEAAGIWTDGDYIPISGLQEGETFGRDKDQTDTNLSWDWAHHGGIDAVAPTPGLQNIGSTLIINEIMYDPATGADWIELYNPGDVPVDLNGYTIMDAANNTYSIDTSILNDLEEIPAGEYLVIVFDDRGSTGSDDYYWSDGDAAELHIEFESGTDDLGLIDSMALYNSTTINSNTIVDYVAWGGTPPGTSTSYSHAQTAGIWTSGDYVDTSKVDQGESIGRDKDSTDTESSTDWVDHGGDDAVGETGGGRNIGGVIINEVSYLNSNSDWIEIYNPTDTPQDLSDYCVSLNDGTTCTDLSTAGLTERIPAGDYLIIHFSAGTDDGAWTDGDIAEVYIGGTGLSDTAASISLYNDSATPDQDSIVDFLAYGTSAPASAADGDAAYDAVQAGIWGSSDVINFSLDANETIGLDMNSSDSDSSSDWGDTGGPDAERSTYGYQNYTSPILPLYILISRFNAFVDSGRVVIEWETAGQHATLGFYLLRLAEENGFIQVNEKILPAILHNERGGTYRLVDPGATPGETYQYELVELENSGKTLNYGPFTVTADTPLPVIENMQQSVISGYSKREKKISPRKAARISAGKTARKEVEPDSNKRRRAQANQLKIVLQEQGMYFVTAAEIADAMNIPVELTKHLIKSNNFSLSNQGNQVAVHPVRDENGFWFYGEKFENDYTEKNVYWLTPYDHGLKMKKARNKLKRTVTENQFFTSSSYIEENKYALYGFNNNVMVKDYWLWDYLLPGFGYDSQVFSLPSPGTIPEGNAHLTAKFFGFYYISDGDEPGYHIEMFLNGVPIGSAEWSRDGAYIIDIEFANSLLNDGDNSLEVQASLNNGVSFSYLLVNNFQLSYQRQYRVDENHLTFHSEEYDNLSISGFSSEDIFIFNITAPNTPLVYPFKHERDMATDQITIGSIPGNSYEAYATPAALKPLRIVPSTKSTLKEPTNEGEYLIITEQHMTSAAQRLADYRSSQGLSSMVIDIEDIYDEFSYGIRDLNAVKDFLRYAASNWNQPPRYITLVGEGSLDVKNYLGFDDSMLPPYLVLNRDGIFVSDNYIADLIKNDSIPELAVGRIPVINEQELNSFIDKLIAFENRIPEPADNRITLVADSFDESGDYTNDNEILSSWIPDVLEIEKLYVDQVGTTITRQGFLQAFSDGRRFINFSGHGSIAALGRNSLLGQNDVESLLNMSQLPVLTITSCLAANFGMPTYDSLGEELLLKPDGGAIAIFAPSGLMPSHRGRELSEYFYDAVFNSNVQRIGDAVLKAKRHYGNVGFDLELLNTVNLLGDPATLIQ